MSQEQQVTFSIILPAFKKAEVIQEVLLNLFLICNESYKSDFECILVIDGGNDLTAHFARELNLEKISIIELSENEGKGHALSQGIRIARGALVGYIDADLDIDVSNLINAFRLLQEDPSLEAVIGSKWLTSHNKTYPFVRRIGSKLFSFIVRILFNLSVSDTQTGLKVFRQNRIKLLVNHKNLDKRFLWDLEVLYYYGKFKWKVAEIPVSLNFRNQTSIRMIDVIKSFAGLLFLKIKLSIIQKNIGEKVD